MAVPSPYGSSSVGLSITSMATAGAKTAGPTEKFAIDVLVICFEIWFVKTFARTLLATGRPIAEQRNACNGRRQRQDRQNIQWTYHWRHLHPVSADFTLVFALGSDDPSRCARASLRSSAVLRAHSSSQPTTNGSAAAARYRSTWKPRRHRAAVPLPLRAGRAAPEYYRSCAASSAAVWSVHPLGRIRALCVSAGPTSEAL
jgi:hypothetical protein